MYEKNTCKNTFKKGWEEKRKFSKILPNNQISAACRTSSTRNDYKRKINHDWPKPVYFTS